MDAVETPASYGLNDISRRLSDGFPRHVVSADSRAGLVSPQVAERAVKAAVLVGIVDRRDRLNLLLHQRARDLPRHPGQVGFSGGVVEDDDEDEIACALRETEEEMGLSRQCVNVFGLLDRCLTGTGYCVTPVVGRVEPDCSLQPDPREVEDVFEVPLAFVLDPKNHVQSSMETSAGTRHFYDLRWEGRRIWGATARMVVNLYERLQVP